MRRNRMIFIALITALSILAAYAGWLMAVPTPLKCQANAGTGCQAASCCNVTYVPNENNAGTYVFTYIATAQAYPMCVVSSNNADRCTVAQFSCGGTVYIKPAIPAGSGSGFECNLGNALRVVAGTCNFESCTP